ncbi:hypothetical protein [Paenibacillus sp. sptzw28]|uniref:hypothetical protein n=1 Tax=Paenibacillus sp. sptzw28 TaxID=715179 RepID=UPI0037C7E00A
MKHPVTLGEGEYFVLGDYWRRSFNDSQTAGPITSSEIVGSCRMGRTEGIMGLPARSHCRN